MKKNITENSTTILNFYRNNKEVIGLKEEGFKQWIENNYYAKRNDGKFIATNFSEENGYMIDKKKAIIDIEEFNCFISYSAFITPKGQEHILNIFENVDGE